MFRRDFQRQLDKLRELGTSPPLRSLWELLIILASQRTPCVSSSSLFMVRLFRLQKFNIYRRTSLALFSARLLARGAIESGAELDSLAEVGASIRVPVDPLSFSISVSITCTSRVGSSVVDVPHLFSIGAVEESESQSVLLEPKLDSLS